MVVVRAEKSVNGGGAVMALRGRNQLYGSSSWWWQENESWWRSPGLFGSGKARGIEPAVA